MSGGIPTSGRTTIRFGWDLYEAQARKGGATDEQVAHARLAFYAGASVMYELTMAAVAHEDDDVCERGVQALSDELEEFVEEMLLTHRPPGPARPS